MEKIVLHNRKGQKIVGDLTLPSGEVRGTAILQYGWGGNRHDSTTTAIRDAFLQSGFQTFVFDTTNTFGESDGDFEKSTLGLHCEDLEDVVTWVIEQPWFVSPLFLAGHSKGDYSVLRYSQIHPGHVNGVVAVGPVVSGKLSYDAHVEHDPTAFKAWEKAGVRVRTSKTGNLRREHWWQMEERLNHDLMPFVSKLTMSVLLVVGEKDTSCPPRHVKMLFDSIPGKKDFKVIPGSAHSFYAESECVKLTTAVYEWLKYG